MLDKNLMLDGVRFNDPADEALFRLRIDHAVQGLGDQDGAKYISVRVCKQPAPDGEASDRPPSDGQSSEELTFRATQPRFSFDRICLADHIKELILSSVSMVENERLLFDEWGLSEIQAAPRSALLLHGPPGTGKTAAAQ